MCHRKSLYFQCKSRVSFSRSFLFFRRGFPFVYSSFVRWFPLWFIVHFPSRSSVCFSLFSRCFPYPFLFRLFLIFRCFRRDFSPYYSLFSRCFLLRNFFRFFLVFTSILRGDLPYGSPVSSVIPRSRFRSIFLFVRSSQERQERGKSYRLSAIKIKEIILSR